MKTMTATAASKEFGHYLDMAQSEPVVITRQNRPVAVTLSIRDAEELIRFRVDAGIAKGQADIDEGRIVPLTLAYGTALKVRFKNP